ncbi:MAG: vWA domain-containing protein [Alphaproteobacteria bacterium]
MQDNVKDTLKKLDIPAPSEQAKERTMLAAMQAFENAQEKSAKGFTESIRPIHTTSTWQQWIRNLNMKKAYAFAGSFAALAVVLAITTTHYSTIMEPVKITADPPATLPEVQTGQPVEMKEEEKAKDDSASLGKPTAPVGVNYGAPGMLGGNTSGESIAAAPPVSAEQNQVFAKHRADIHREAGRVAQEMVAGNAAPGMAADKIMPYPQPMPPQYYGGDKFEHKQANLAKAVANDPVSTFSIDVDTASYSFVRRMLNQGQLPQPEMVRVEEMINYLPYNYELPQDKAEPFKPSITVLPSPWNADKKLVHIGIKGFDITHIKRPSANLVFLIDVSGSMNSPDKLPLLKSSLHMLVDQIDAMDTVSIVTYAGHAGTALSPTKGSDKQTIRSVIDQLGVGGSTAGAAGVEQAYTLAQQHFNKDGVNRVILATDGDFNVGINDPALLKTYIEQKRATGISLSVLGFGQGNYNDALMQSLAQHGNGNAAYIDNINEARKVLVDEMSSTLFTIAKDVKIQVEWNPAAVSEYRLVGYETRLLNREDFNNDKVDAGDVGAGHAVTAIYEITPKGAKGTVDPLRYSKQEADVAAQPSSEFSGEYGFLKMRYKLPDSTESKLITTPISNAQEVASVDAAPQDVKFAAAVAGFGQLLKRDPAVAGLNYDQLITLADGARGSDVLRTELVNLIRTAKGLQGGVVYPLPMPEHDAPTHGHRCNPGQRC